LFSQGAAISPHRSALFDASIRRLNFKLFHHVKAEAGAEYLPQLCFAAS
jgi:hypothetical protein